MIIMKCQGVINKINNCSNKAIYKSTGYSAQFGVPSNSFVCESCKKIMIKFYQAKILTYNQFPLTFETLIYIFFSYIFIQFHFSFFSFLS